MGFWVGWQLQISKWVASIRRESVKQVYKTSVITFLTLKLFPLTFTDPCFICCISPLLEEDFLNFSHRKSALHGNLFCCFVSNDDALHTSNALLVNAHWEWSIGISELCLSFYLCPNISDRFFNLAPHFIRIQLFQIYF